MQQAATVLGEQGSLLFPLQPPDARQVVRIYLGLVSADGLRSLKDLIGSCQRESQIKRQLLLASLPRAARKLLQAGLSTLGEIYLAELLSWTGQRTVKEYWDLTVQLDTFRQQFRRLMESGPAGQIDLFLFPVYGLPALRHGTALDMLPAASYLFLANLLGWPAGSVPFTQVEAGEETDRPPSRDSVTRIARQIELGSTGLPVGVQVMARPWREDLVLAAMRVLEKSLAANCPGTSRRRS